MNDLDETELKKHVKDKDTWVRFVFLVGFGGVFYLVSLIVFAICIFQFLAKLFSGSIFPALAELGENLACYLGQITRYATFAGDIRPFPFTPFPSKKCEDK